MANPTTPTNLVQKLLDHIQAVSTGAAPPDIRLFEDGGHVLPDRIDTDHAKALILALYRLSFHESFRDPTPLTKLLEALVRPVAFDDILDLEPPVDFTAGLSLRARPFHSLCLTILEKAAADADLARRLATTHPEAFGALVNFWLTSDDEALAHRAGALLQGLLRVDRETEASAEEPSGGPIAGIVASAGWRGAVWRRFFRDRDTLDAIIRVCDNVCHPGWEIEGGERSVGRVRGAARARLLEWIPAVARMDWDAVSRYHLPSEMSCGHVKEFRYGLLEFAINHGYDKQDVLLYRLVCNAVSELITIQESWGDSSESQSLEVATSLGFHDQFTSMYLDPHGKHGYDDLDMTLLRPAVVEYVMVYISSYPDLFGASPFCQQVLDRLESTLDQPPRHWGDDGAADLAVLRFFPKRYLLQSPTPRQGANILGLLEPKLGEEPLLRTLAAVFTARAGGVGTVPSAAASAAAHVATPDRAAARLLYFHYLEQHANLWYFVGFHADAGPARKNLVLASLDLIDAMVDAEWSTDVSWITDDSLQALADRFAPRAPTPLLALISGEAMGSVLTNLMAVPKALSLARDDDHVAHEIATRRYDVLARLFARLSDETAAREDPEERTTLRSLGDQIRQRLRAGVWPRTGRASAVATIGR